MDEIRVYPGGPVHPGWQMMMQALLEAPNASATDLARMVGVSTHTIRKWRKMPEFQRYQTWFLENKYLTTPAVRPGDIPIAPRAERAKKLSEEISEYAVEMFDRLKDIVETTEDEKLIVHIANSMMDRAGFIPVKTVKHEHGRITMTPELLAIFNQRAVEAGEAPVVEGVVLGKGHTPPAIAPPKNREEEPLT